ncbi:hypothetical protein GIY11_11685 [Aerococcaceae bacterium DSM 109653]|uniref:Uncharacterized protein n=1 Tax=Fundicoccus ignavus TaxID=2664442 RepID=A0A844BWY3_9LACT|nr:hypothetical protein [Fundicoccus ignavus]MRI82672.1 hypothetical protein [Fundicoccus ignavus]
MDNLVYVVDLLQTKCGISVKIEDIGYESINLEREELDERLLPHYFEEIQTGREVMIHLYAVEEYLVYILADLKDMQWLLIGILEADNLIYTLVPDY